MGAVALAVATGLGGVVLTATPAAAHGTHVLVFSKTAGYRHDAIPDGIAAITELGAQNGFEVEATEDAAAFTDENLAGYAAVIWLSTTGDVLNEAQQAAFERYIDGGGGYAGVHAAADTEYSWPWYGELVGSYFKSHPQIQEADVVVEDREHPSTAHLPGTWTRTDEWYSYQSNPRGRVKVLAALDETSYTPTDPSGDHPIVWCQGVGQGRSWYTGMGHTKESYTDAAFREHLLGGISHAAGIAEADCAPDPDAPPTDADFDQVTLALGSEKTGEPIALAVLPDRKVVHTSRDGRVWLTTPQATTTLAGRIPVYNHDEDGLQGVAVDPDFATNRWLYLYYAPPLDTPAGDAPTDGTAADFAPFKGHNQLSRFTLTTDGVLDTASEQQILRVPADRGICCHAGGEIDFDAQGNLYLSTGDDSNPFASDGYTPIDERATRNPAYDAQRSSANTNDLRGKILRVTVAEDGSYTVPSGNLFAPGTDRTRPEIYAMGFRNPFRFAVDRATGWVHLGDYGPDAGSANPARGPGGLVEFNLIKEPGNYGWPYCVGDNTPYIDYDFASGASGASGAPFDCAAPKNTSPNNTGLVDLPPAKPAWIPYDGASVPEFGGGGESPMGGPTYHFDPANEMVTKFPEFYDGKNFAYEWDRGWIKTIEVGPNGERGPIQPFFNSMTLTRPMNLEFGPDGSLYVLDYGSGYFGGAADSAVYRIDYTRGNHTPVAKLAADKTSGPAPLTVSFDPAGTTDEDGPELTWAWDFDGDGTTDSTEEGPVSHTYDTIGQYSARLSVTDPTGLTGSATVVVNVGNTAPTVTITAPANGTVFTFGDEVPFEVTVSDPEDGEVDCSKVTVEYILGHDSHGHPLSRETGCQGTIATPSDGGHGADANIFGVINASYTDEGAPGATPLTGSDEIILQPKTKQAEFFTTNNGVQVVEAGGAVGNKRVGYIDNGDWIMFDPVNLAGVGGIGYRVSSGGAGGVLEVRSGAVDGPLVQSVPVGNTGGWDTYADIPAAPITDPGGTHPLYLVFKGSGSGGLYDIDEIRFDTSGSVGPRTLLPAESFDTMSGVNLFDDAAAQGGRQVGDVEDGDWIAFEGVDLADVTGLGYRVASDTQGGTIEVRADAPDGPLVQSTAVGNTGGWRTYANLPPTPVTDPGGPRTLYFVFRGGAGPLFDVDTIVVEGTLGRTCVPSTPEAGYRALYNGTADSLADWRMAGPGRFVQEDNCAIRTEGGLGLLWFPEEFNSYSLRMDWKLAGDDNSGVFVGFPDPGTDPWVAVNSGYEIQIDPTDAADRTTGAVYSFQSADIAARDAALKPAGQWNAYEITVTGQTIKVFLNGALVNEFTSADPARDLTQGYVGLQNHGVGDDVWFRNVRIKEIDATAPTTTASTDPAAPASGWHTTAPVTVTLSANEDGATTRYRVGGDWLPYTGPFTLGEGTHAVEYRSTDAAGNVEAVKTLAVKVDTTAPLTTAEFPGDWSTEGVSVVLTATDAGSGPAGTEWSLDGGAWTAYTGPVAVSGDGEHTLLYRSRDIAGNAETDKAATIKIDATAPTLVVSGIASGRVYGDATDVVVSWSGADETSGLKSVTGGIDGAALTSGAVVALHTLPLGVHELSVTAVDNAGNRTVSRIPFATTTSLRDIGQLLDRFRASNRLTLAEYQDLSKSLAKARKAEAAGDDAKAARELGAFKRAVSKVTDAGVRTVLARDTDHVIGVLTGSAAKGRRSGRN
ncbi:ThuA domain-containing protein [Actinokineospora sp. 24-640]